MHFCEQCGSASRDKDGFCGGCGAPWPLVTPPATTKQTGTEDLSPYATLPAKINSIGLDDAARPKVVSVAVLLALLLGPVGLTYCTMTGAIVMLIVSAFLQFLFGRLSILFVLPICAIWAWRAARESTSALD